MRAEPPNDFAYWVNTALQDEALAEKLAAIDTVQYSRIKDLRERIVQTIEDHIDRIGHFHVADVPGRHEPGTGELNYGNIIRAIDASKALATRGSATSLRATT